MDAAQDGERIMTEADVILLRTTVASLDAYRPGICSRTKQKGPASLKSARQQENDDNDQDYPDDADAAVTKPIAVAGADVPAAEPAEK